MFFGFPVKGKKVCHRFIEKPDCYLDQETGLEWSKDNSGPCTWGRAIEMFKDPVFYHEFVEKKNTEWRVPTIQELLTLVDYKRYDPATSLPGMMLSLYWSSTTYAYLTSYAWLIYFGYGYGSYGSKSSSYYVRAVREGK